MTDPKPATPATDEQVKAWIELGADGRLFIPAHVIDSLVARIAADRETIKAKDEEIERLKGVHRAWINEDQASAELATAREQVRVLREALKAALGHCDCSDYRGMALIPCTEANPCAGCYTTRIGQAALAATEPKG